MYELPTFLSHEPLLTTFQAIAITAVSSQATVKVFLFVEAPNPVKSRPKQARCRSSQAINGSPTPLFALFHGSHAELLE
jgi:hypothetical protein